MRKNGLEAAKPNGLCCKDYKDLSPYRFSSDIFSHKWYESLKKNVGFYRFGFRGKSTTLCEKKTGRWEPLEVGGWDIDQIPNHKFGGWRFGTKFLPGFDRSVEAHARLDVGKNHPGFLQFPYFFDICLYQVLPQKPANISPTVGTLGQLGRNPYLGHFQVTTVYIFPFFTSFPQKKQIKSKSSRKKSTLQSSIFAQPKKKNNKRPFREGRTYFSRFFFPPENLPVNRNRKPPLNLGGRAAPSGSLLSTGGDTPKRCR